MSGNAHIAVARTQVYTDLIGPPTVATSPIPPATAAKSAPAAAAAAEDNSGPVTKVHRLGEGGSGHDRRVRDRLGRFGGGDLRRPELVGVRAEG